MEAQVFDTEKEAARLFTDSDSLLVFFEQGIRPEHFFDPDVADMYRFALGYLREHGGMEEAPSKIVMTHQHGEYPNILAETVGEVQASYIADRLKEKFTKQQLQAVIVGATQVMPNDPIQAAENLQAASTAIIGLNTNRTQHCVYGENIEYQRKRYEDSHRNSEDESFGAPYMLDEMNDLSGGIRGAEVAIWAARQKTGKTWFACGSAIAGVKLGWDVYFASLEMSVDDIANRIDLIEARAVPPAYYDRGLLVPDMKYAIHDAQERIASYPGKLVIDHLSRDEKSIENIMARARLNRCRYLIIDQLQFIKRPNGLPRHEAIEEIMYQVKDLAKGRHGEDDLSVLLLHQMTRDSNKVRRNDNIGVSEDLGMSAATEQVADAIWGMARTNEMASVGLMNIGVMDARRYPPKAWQCKWDLTSGVDIRVNKELTDF